tara:strand:+ start:1511 stop:2287 length:777 start_codon:yes stop_codon:yes gene_type:complete
MNRRPTQMTEDTFKAIRIKQQVDKYKALNTYKIKLSTTQAVNYTESTTELATHDQSGLAGEQNTILPYWYLPAIEGNHIENCLMRIKSVSTSISVYTFNPVDPTLPSIDYSKDKSGDNIIYIMCDSLIQKTFCSNSSGKVIRKPILGTYNYSHLIKDNQDEFYKESIKEYGSKTSNTAMMDDGWILAKNPFGGKISLHLEHFDNNVPLIKSSRDGLPGNFIDEGTHQNISNNIINTPIIYELEIKLLPDNQSNDRFSY